MELVRDLDKELEKIGLDKELEEIFRGEFDSAIIIEEKSSLVLRDYMAATDKQFYFIDPSVSELDKMANLKNDYVYLSSDCELFLDILNSYNYNMMNDIRCAVRILGNLEEPNVNKKVIEKLLNSPVIQDISFNGLDQYTIFSDRYGSVSFNLAREYFKDNLSVLFYMGDDKLVGMCHYNTKYLTYLFPEFYAVTSLCKSYFDMSYYHSYTYDKKSDKIIDLCYNLVMDKDVYYDLNVPDEVSVILNSEVDRQYNLIDGCKTTSTNSSGFVPLLKIALYKQYLDSIGYCGDLESAPVISKVKR